LINDAKVRIKSLIKEGKRAARAVFLRKVVSSYKPNKKSNTDHYIFIFRIPKFYFTEISSNNIL
jgi:hypothetical protein